MNTRRTEISYRCVMFVVVIGLIVGTVACDSRRSAVILEDRVVQLTIDTLDHDLGCASARITLNNLVIDNLDPVQTPWNYEFTAQDRNQIEVLVCPSCDECSVRCTLDDRMSVSIAVDGAHKGLWESLGRGEENDFECMLVVYRISD